MKTPALAFLKCTEHNLDVLAKNNFQLLAIAIASFTAQGYPKWYPRDSSWSTGTNRSQVVLSILIWAEPWLGQWCHIAFRYDNEDVCAAARSHDEDAKSCCYLSNALQSNLEHYSGFPSNDDCLLKLKRWSESNMSTDFLRFWSECNVDGRPERY